MRSTSTSTSGAGAFIHRETHDLGASNEGRPGRLVLVFAHQHVTEGGLARPVGAHQDVDLAERNINVHSFEDLEIAEELFLAESY